MVCSRPFARLFVLGVVGFNLVACANTPEVTHWSEVDSAGVAIVSGPPPGREVGVVDSVPLLEVAEAAALPLFRASAVLPREDGSFLVLDAGNHRILLFSEQGDLLTQAGQQGDGPGEFQTPAVAVQHADSTLVYDGRHRRVTVFDQQLELVRDRPLEMAGGGAPPRFVGVLGGGAWVGSVGQPLDGLPSSGLLRSPMRYIALDGPDPGRTLGDGKGAERWVNIAMSGGEISNINVVGYPFYRATEAVVVGDNLVMGDTDTWALSMRDANGTLLRILRMNQAPGAFGEAGVQEYLDSFIDQEPAERREREQALATIERPETLPAFAELRTDDKSRIWVRAFSFSRSDAQRWYVFDDSGALGTATMPAGFSLQAIRAERLYGVFRDEFEVESVRVYRFTETP